MSLRLGCELVDAADHEICAENHLLLKLQLLGPKNQAQSREQVGKRGRNICEVAVKAKGLWEILHIDQPCRIGLRHRSEPQRGDSSYDSK